MTALTFYGGVNEIGGNKILLEDDNRSLFLDFGYPYGKYRDFYEEYLKPRAGAGLLDLLVMGIIPPLEGIYRDDLETPDLWPRFRRKEHYRRLERVDGILLTHAHLDHSGHISLLGKSIPVYATATTAFIAKAIQDSGKADFDQQVCYFSPKIQDSPHGLKQVAYITSRTSNQQRRFCIADREPEKLSPEAITFWHQGFWEKTPKQKELISCDLEDHAHCSFRLRCFPVDHSIPGACAWGIETSSGWVIYSGDLRLHGKRGKLTEAFIQEAARLHPKALVLEGTNVGREMNVAEREVQENALKAIANSTGLVIADFSPRDVDRLLTFLQIARETKRKLAILPKDAYLLKTMRLLEPETPDLAKEDAIVIYQETTASTTPRVWLRNIYQENSSKVVLAEDIAAHQDDFILCFSFFDLNELPSIYPKAGSLYLLSSSEPHSEEQKQDFWRLHHWLKHFGMRRFGVPIRKNGDDEESGGQWEIPEAEKGLHASGHACGPDLLRIAREIRPELLIPVHCEKPEFYMDNLGSSQIKVVLPEESGTIEI
jgi:ribonuclease J